jgi:hypothetical protein
VIDFVHLKKRKNIFSQENKTIIKMKIIFSIAFVMLTQMFFGQTVFDKYDGKEDINVVAINKKMFDLMGKVKMDASDKDTQLYLNLIKKLDNLKVFTTKNARVENDMKLTAEKYVKSSGLEDLTQIDESGRNIKISIKSDPKDQQIKELLLFIEGTKNDDAVLMSLTGSFDLSELSALTDKMKIPGGDALKKASKGVK